MKKSILTTASLVASVFASVAQSNIQPDNSTAAGGVALNTAANYFGGTGSVQIWYHSGTTLANNINGQANVTAYNNLTADGFTLAQTYTSVPFTVGGFTEPTIQLSGIAAGASCEIAVVAWNSGTHAWGTFGDSGGVVLFVNTTANPAGSPPPPVPKLTGMTADLLMTPFPAPAPEPASIAFAGLGLGAFLIARRKK